MNDITEESGGTLEYTAEFTPNDMQDFAAMIIDRDGDKIIPRFYRYENLRAQFSFSFYLEQKTKCCRPDNGEQKCRSQAPKGESICVV